MKKLFNLLFISTLLSLNISLAYASGDRFWVQDIYTHKEKVYITTGLSKGYLLPSTYPIVTFNTITNEFSINYKDELIYEIFFCDGEMGFFYHDRRSIECDNPKELEHINDFILPITVNGVRKEGKPPSQSIQNNGFTFKKHNNTFTITKNNSTITGNIFEEGVVLITAEGYFDYIGDYSVLKNLTYYHDGNIYDLNSFYDIFYRPDIIQAKLQGDTKLYQASVSMEDVMSRPAPTDVKITIPQGADKQKTISVNYKIISDVGGIGDVMVLHNGKLVKSDTSSALKKPSKPMFNLQLSDQSANYRALIRKPTALTVPNVLRPPRTDRIYHKGDVFSGKTTIPLIAGKTNEITVVAYNQDNTLMGEPVKKIVKNTLPTTKPKLYSVAVGINEFKNVTNLVNAKADAKDFISSYTNTLKQMHDYEIQDPIILLDKQATTSNILKSLQQIAKVAEPQDMLVWFISSHGILDDNSVYNIVTHDTNCLPSLANCSQMTNTISSNDIFDIGQNVSALKQVFVFDTCHAGGVDSKISGLYDARMSVLAKNMGFHLMAGAAATEYASDGINGNGLFTYSLLKGLKGDALDFDMDKYVSISEMGRYAKNETELQSSRLGFHQSPFIRNFGDSFEIYKKK